MEDSLPPPVRSRYNRVSTKHPRVVVPVIRGTCYGCFVSVPTALASDADRNEDIRSCQSCGRFLYLID
jgi:predicted  nucleic acid-binding Zn-ribbon protein